ncbi:hypothetical protein K378_01409 [Streptomyces sp. Amel2xB2]|uniref:hypothetical protein n=1 Tax=Streptomyces sp. Amel2xB2 TaxID=1305829 RepID=UPI000DB92B22|nr:hypothetical protein [Streptomyces sp. Amel2xB2]RAJ70244.1 hypothetical protein K378_01409 [Streptomyces sp. Amel2xB2]
MAARTEAVVTAAVAVLSYVVAVIVGYTVASYGLRTPVPHLAALGTTILTFTVASKLADAWLDSRKAKAGEQ